MPDVKKMQLGQLVDFCLSYNERQKQAEELEEKQKNPPKYRMASPAEVSAYYG